MALQGEQRARTIFVTLWVVVASIKVAIASRLPLFVDEAFYWQEGQHLAAAYSDLPGLTAWMVRAGVEVFGNHVLGVRSLFLLMGALLPWMIAFMGMRWFGVAAGWRAGSLTVLMPLSATLGMLAVPDVPLAFSAVLCLAAGAYLLRRVDAKGVALLALGLVIGAQSHYRFLGVIGFGFLALLALPEGRRVLRDPRVWIALSVGIVAWLPLLAWNSDHHDAGMKFQLVERHPWRFGVDGVLFAVVQPLVVTPFLFWAMVQSAAYGIQLRDRPRVQWRYFALVGGISTVLIFVLGFFTDVDRISFHWPLPSYLALLLVVPVIAYRWPKRWRQLGVVVLSLGCVLALGYYLLASTPALRSQLAGQKYYPRNFAGWQPLADAVAEELARMPAGTRVLAGNFKIGSELGFLRNDARIAVMPHLLNDKHGRAVQLQLWGLLQEGAPEAPHLLVLSPSDYRYKDLLAYYHQVCAQLGPLPPPRVVSIDHGAQRFLLFSLPGGKASGTCVTPAMAWVDTPVAGTVGRDQVNVSGWAFKDGVGLAKVEVTLDGEVVAVARYGRAHDVRGYWKISNDPQHPQVGFDAQVDLSAVAPGTHWLGLRLHGNDGSIEDWWEQSITVAR